MTNYFDFAEFIRSDTARARNIENIPTWEYIQNLIRLRDEILNPLRADWGSVINVTSGFRCFLLNKAVGGSETSAHQIGFAVDIIPANGKMDEFIQFCRNWFKDKNFDQVIIETKGTTRWVHISLVSIRGEQRRQLFNLTK